MKDISNAVHIKESQFQLNGHGIYLKRSKDCREFVAEEIAKFLDVNVLHYEVGVLNGNLVTFSESFYNEDEIYISGSHILSEYLLGLPDRIYLTIKHLNNLPDIFRALESVFGYKFNNDIQKINYDLVKMFCFDVLLINYDREALNWGIILGKDGIRLAPLFDNEAILTGSKLAISMGMDSENNDILFTDLLEKFFAKSDLTLKDIFLNMYDKLTPAILNSIFEKVEKDRNITIDENYRAVALTNYVKHRNSLETIVEQYRQDKKIL